MSDNNERTLVLVKPDGVRRGLVGEVLSRIERRGYVLDKVELRMADEALLRAHYVEHVDKPFFGGLLDYMTSGPVLAIVASGAQVIEAFRVMAGATDPIKAAAGTIRGDFGRNWGDGEVQNIVHGSDSPESAEREIGLWFPEA